MRDVRPGDLVIHSNDSILVGFSFAKTGFSETRTEPPQAGPWKDRPSYYRIELRDYTPFEAPVPLTAILTKHAKEIRDEIEAGGLYRYPFVIQSGSLNVAQGAYLPKVTPHLYEILRQELTPREIDTRAKVPPKAEDPFEGLFMSREKFQEITAAANRKKTSFCKDLPESGKLLLLAGWRRFYADLLIQSDLMSSNFINPIATKTSSRDYGQILPAAFRYSRARFFGFVSAHERHRLRTF